MNLIGRFYLKQTKSGNLIGEFSNNKSNSVYSESAEIRHENKHEFIGEYLSTWHDEETGQLFNLIISYKPKTENKIFRLKWSDNNTIFFGEGFIVDDILIGDYRDFE